MMLLFIMNIANAQNLHVKYKYIRSPILTMNENLYINKQGNVLSVQDSIVNFYKLYDNGNVTLDKDSKKIPPFYYISDLNDGNNRDFYFSEDLKNDVYFIYDKDVPKPQWKIFEDDTKKIAGFVCTKAISNFRGSEITAYFAKELPYSSGPFKFYGLPGLILEAKVKDKPYYIWRAEEVNLIDNSQITFKPKLKNVPKAKIKDFVEMKNEANTIFANGARNAVPNSTAEPYNKRNRNGVELIYEWEEY